MSEFIPKKAKRYKPNENRNKSFTPEKYEPKQESTSKMGYGKDWQTYRFRFLHHNKQCYVCGGKSTVVDHIVAHKKNTELFEATNNHLPLCAKDHNVITGKFDRKVVQDLEGKMAWIKKRRELNGIDFPVKVLAQYRKKKKK